ncbi:MAG TPA: alcohol dehydrogenase catalytic domain-containing protein [Streptosporangiaceae bacterium]|jgi:L-iditol 2-dehydrogenase
MKAARLHGPGRIEISDEPVPSPGPGESLVRVTAIGICGSDLHWYAEAGIGDSVLDRPLVLGHEAAGVIEGGPRHGERVAIDPAIPCMTCSSCLRGYRNLCTRLSFAGHGDTDGAMRGYLTWPSHLLFALPDSVSDAGGALLEPLGVAVHAAGLGHGHLGETAAVAGCGPIGLLLIQVLRASGVARIIAFDPLQHRRAAAARLGADEVHDPASVGESDDLSTITGEGADVTFEMAGTDSGVRLAMAAARPGARVVLGGIPDDDRTRFPAALARRKGLTIAMVRRMNEVYPRAIWLAASGRVELDSLVSERFPVAQTASALATATRREGLKVVIED